LPQTKHIHRFQHQPQLLFHQLLILKIPYRLVGVVRLREPTMLSQAIR
jgi:hypothetical protein